MSFLVAFRTVLTYSFSVAAILVGVWVSCVVFAIVSWTIHEWDRVHALVVGVPTLLAAVVVGVAAVISAFSGNAGGRTAAPHRRGPATEAVLKLELTTRAFASAGDAAYGFDQSGRLFEIARANGTWRRRYVRRRPLPAVSALVSCGEYLAVAYGHGSVALLSPTDGSIERHRRYLTADRDELSLACVGQWLFAVRDGSGAIVRILAETLQPYSEWVGKTPITAMAAGTDRLFVASRSTDQIGVVADLNGTFDEGAFTWNDVTAPEAIAAAGDHLFIAHAGMRCVSRFDKHGVEHRPRVPVGGGPMHLVGGRGQAYAIGEDSGTLVDVTFAGTRDLGRHVTVAKVPVAAALADGRVLVADDGPKPVVRVYARQALSNASKAGHFRLGAACKEG